jgi:hypothetical protein
LIVLMVGSRVRLGRSKTVWQRLLGDKSASQRGFLI